VSASIQLFFQRLRCFARTLACAGIGACALTAHGQATAMTETAVATDVHQTLDVHGGFTTQVTFDGDTSDLIADFF